MHDARATQSRFEEFFRQADAYTAVNGRRETAWKWTDLERQFEGEVAKARGEYPGALANLTMT